MREIFGNEFAFEAGRVYSIPALALLVTIVLFLVGSLLNGFGRRELLVITGSVISLPVLFVYPLLTPRDGAAPSRGFAQMLVGLGGYIAYGLACYLTFYAGLWGLVRLLWGFSVWALLWSIVCGVVGLTLVNGLYQLTELCRAVDEGRIIVRKGHRPEG